MDAFDERAHFGFPMLKQRYMSKTRWVVSFCGSLLIASLAQAQTNVPTVNCADQPNPIYVARTAGVLPFFKAIQPSLYAGATPYTIVAQEFGSCPAATGLYQSTKLVKDKPEVPAMVLPDGSMSAKVAANYAHFYAPDGTLKECFVPAGGVVPDIAVSNVLPETCGIATENAGTIGNFEGPIITYVFVVPLTSTQTSISSEAAYDVFGTGGNKGRAVPWTDPSVMLIRSPTAGTQQMIAKAIGVPVNKWWGVDQLSNDAMRTNLRALGSNPQLAEKTIGILQTEFSDVDKDNYKVLAFQGKNQKCGYLPDKTILSRDKLNVREGRYTIWGPLHFYARTYPTVPKDGPAAVVTRFTAQKIDQELLDAIIAAHEIPRCAMRVKRDGELTDLKPYVPEVGCSCYFESKVVGAVADECQTCKFNADCPSARPACNYGFCEPKP